MRSRPPSSGGPTRRPLKKRLVSVAALTCSVALLALAAGALFAPTFVFGSEDGSQKPGPDYSFESTEIPLGPAAATDDTAPAGAPVTSASTDAAAPIKACAGEVTPSTGSLLVTLPWGSGDGEVGLVEPDQGLARGPEALAVAPNGRIAVLDSVNKRVLVLSDSGQVTGTIALSLSEPRFLAVTSDRIYVLDCDCDHRLATLTWSGAACGSPTLLPALPDAVSGLFATSQGPCVEVAHAHAYRITNRVPGKSLSDLSDSDLYSSDLVLRSMGGRPLDSALTRLVSARFAPGASPVFTASVTTESGVAVRSTSLDLPLPADRSIEHLLSVDGTASGDLVVGARLLDLPDSTEPASLLLTKFLLADDGAITASAPADGSDDSLLLVDTSIAYVGLPYTVAPDGRVFQPIATQQGYAIFVHLFPSAAIAAQAAEVQP